MLIKPINLNKTYLFCTNCHSTEKNKNNNTVQQNQNISFKSRQDSRLPYYTIPIFHKCEGQKKKETFDSFTGLRDKNCLICNLDTLIETSKKTGKEFAVAMFDMDNFKSVNDLLGYKTGDDFIKVISNNVSAVAEENNLKAYRFGGEEFVILFDNQSDKQRQDVVNAILKSVGSDPTICSKEEEYSRIANSKLDYYLNFHNKISHIVSLKASKDLLEDLNENFTTPEAKYDPYFQETYLNTCEELNKSYVELIVDRLPNERNRDSYEWLSTLKDKIENNEKLLDSEAQELNEYLQEIYDRSFEIHKLKKWIKDFEDNNGFSITGGLIRFNPQTIGNKTAIDIINDVGDILQNGKKVQKGKGYCQV